MTPEETFEKLLGLGSSWMIRTDYEAEQNTFVICVSETEALWAEESARHGQTVTCYDHVEPMQWRHLNPPGYLPVPERAGGAPRLEAMVPVGKRQSRPERT